MKRMIMLFAFLVNANDIIKDGCVVSGDNGSFQVYKHNLVDNIFMYDETNMNGTVVQSRQIVANLVYSVGVGKIPKIVAYLENGNGTEIKIVPIVLKDYKDVNKFFLFTGLAETKNAHDLYMASDKAKKLIATLGEKFNLDFEILAKNKEELISDSKGDMQYQNNKIFSTKNAKEIVDSSITSFWSFFTCYSSEPYRNFAYAFGLKLKEALNVLNNFPRFDLRLSFVAKVLEKGYYDAKVKSQLLDLENWVRECVGMDDLSFMCKVKEWYEDDKRYAGREEYLKKALKDDSKIIDDVILKKTLEELKIYSDIEFCSKSFKTYQMNCFNANRIQSSVSRSVSRANNFPVTEPHGSGVLFGDQAESELYDGFNRNSSAAAAYPFHIEKK